ncbi:ankyrin repeat domain-containing protein [Pedobacter rhizosphaerae]|uniref:Ankyrin repeat-containing protein n=1 Tax=Pedobacter rhizosphaerae TaxID=390241 RepID=A0A1H9QR35_9SPHI|nr:ankyrin repeat domain-containing protein [Pedobacter rhizosphaerae]SER62904.1 Ankyrin repeat-containing protein [Pedobacter rhizosphaerae]
MGIFSKKEKKSEVKSSYNEENEINLFDVDIHSEAFLEKVRELKDVNKKFQKGFNLLHFACEYHNIQLAKELLERNIAIEEKNIHGNTPLWIAVFNSKENYEMVDLLMLHHANPNSVNNAGNTPLKLAESFGDELLIRRLKPTG